MTTSPRRPRRRPSTAAAASLGDQLNDYAFDRGVEHFNTVNAGQVRRLTTGQQLVGAAALYYSGWRLLLDGVELLTPRPKKRRPTSGK